MPKKSTTRNSKNKNKQKIENEVNQIKEVLKKEISKREIETEELAKSLEEQKRFLLHSENELEQYYRRIDEEVENISKIKNQMLGYTLQIISIVIGIFAIILSVSFLWFNIEDLCNDFKWIFVSIIAYFGIIFTIWFIIWIKRD